MDDKNAMVIFQPSGRRGKVPVGATIMEAAIHLGEEIESLCGGQQVCGKCKVLIETGHFEKFGIESKQEHAGPLQEVESNHLSEEDIAAGFRMACATTIHGDLLVYVPKESRTGKQVVSKAARDLAFDPDPAVKIYTVALAPASLENSAADLERLCQALAEKYQLPEELRIDVYALRSLRECLSRGGDLTVSVWQGQEILRVHRGDPRPHYGLAIDIGTTTLAAYLCDLTTAEVVTTASLMNPQVQFGEDVISRINYHMNYPDGLARMSQTVVDGIHSLIEDALAAASETTGGAVRPNDIEDVAVCGNTLMHHILLQLDPDPLGAVPFQPANHASMNIKARDLGIHVNPSAYVYTLPNEAGFVGGDNVGVILAEEPHQSHETVLIIDIGTNGELILGNKDRMICSTCSCATGPALEGAQIEFGMRAAPGAIERVRVAAGSFEVDFKVVGRHQWRSESQPEEMRTKGICGSGIIDALAELFKAGIVTRSGAYDLKAVSDRLRENPDSEMMEFVLAWADETSIGRDVVITQNDIRQVQLAKAAIYTGCKLMLERMKLEKPDRIKLAGAFGNYIDPKMAAVIGLFPDCPLDHIVSVGNAAGDGCRMALLNCSKRLEADWVARHAEYVELTLVKDFQEHLIEAIHLPHMTDSFSHFDALLPSEPSSAKSGKSR